MSPFYGHFLISTIPSAILYRVKEFGYFVCQCISTLVILFYYYYAHNVFSDASIWSSQSVIAPKKDELLYVWRLKQTGVTFNCISKIFYRTFCQFYSHIISIQ